MCVFWEEVNGVWSTEGLVTRLEKGHVICSSTHLTSFSILLVQPKSQSMINQKLYLQDFFNKAETGDYIINKTETGNQHFLSRDIVPEPYGR